MMNQEPASQPEVNENNGPDAAATNNAPPSLEQQVEEERAKAERYLASWQRAQADFANYKRRVEGERSEAGRLASASLIINLLPALDDLERALGTVDAKLAGLNWVEGIRLIHRKLKGALEAAGLTEISTEGQDFDPNVHEAVMYAEGEDGKVVQEIQRGYRLGERVLRPSMVVVGKRGVGGQPDEQQQGNGS
jgi:molecular chaperone GrpE